MSTRVLQSAFVATVSLALVAGGSASAAAPKEMEPLAFLLGVWNATGGGKPGEGTGNATFSRRLQDRVILRESYAEYPATSTAPAARHDDLMIIHAGEGAAVKADYYDNEGHVIHYAVTVAAPGEASFVSELVGGAPRFRLNYKLGADDVLKGEFAVAPPGSPEAFSPYLAWESRRAGSAGKGRP